MISFVNKVPPGLRDNEEGFVLVTSLMILMVLMVIGVVTTSTTSTDVKIAGNDKRYKQNFYKAEGATQEMAWLIEDATADDLKDMDSSKFGDESTNPPTSVESSWDPLADYLAVDNGVSKGGSLDMTNPSRIHIFDIYGCAEKVTIKIGYRKRY